MHKYNKIMFSLIGILFTGIVNAQTSTNFNSNAALESKCIISAENMSLGTITTFDVEKIALGNVSALCSKGVAYTIQPEGGHVTADSAGRYQFLKNSENNDHLMVAVNYLNSSGTWRTWGRNGSNGTYQAGLDKLTGTGTGALVVHPIRAVYNKNSTVSSYNAAYTNTYNYEARAGIYSLNMTATIIY